MQINGDKTGCECKPGRILSLSKTECVTTDKCGNLAHPGTDDNEGMCVCDQSATLVDFTCTC